MGVEDGVPVPSYQYIPTTRSVIGTNTTNGRWDWELLHDIDGSQDWEFTPEDFVDEPATPAKPSFSTGQTLTAKDLNDLVDRLWQDKRG